MTKKDVKPAPKPPKVKPPPAKSKPGEATHRQRFEQLLDDVVLGVPPKR
jgi:hypothetical protein